jgi:parallel beta-helix repeat protein
MFCLVLVSSVRVSVVRARGTIIIRPDGSVDPSTAPIQWNGNLYTLTGDVQASIFVQRSNIMIEGNNRTVQDSSEGSGFALSNVNNVTIKNAYVRGFSYGIYLNSSSGNSLISNNIAESCWDGIWLRGSSNNTISKNNLANNYGGIALFDASSNNNIVGNFIIACTNVGFEVYRSSNNTVYSNTLIGNTFQVHSTASTNIWDNGPPGGNYWSDYTGVDSNGDGIGDTPYIIDANNQDRYPLMNHGVIAEFQGSLIGTLSMIATLLAVLAIRKKNSANGKLL